MSSPKEEDARMMERPDTWPGPYLPVINRTGEWPVTGAIAEQNAGVRVYVCNIVQLSWDASKQDTTVAALLEQHTEFVDYINAEAAVAAGWEID